MVDNSDVLEGMDGSEIAIIGMSGRFPGANNLQTYWSNLRDGIESITPLSDTDLLASGVSQADLNNPNYVKAAPLLDNIDLFDASFFGYSAVEAEIMDPQQRVLLESAWEALEHAGYDPKRYAKPVGVYAGAKTNTYLFHLAAQPDLLRSIDFFQIVLGGDLAMLSTRLSYKFDLKGPSYAIQTACSTSLVAVHLACQSLLIGECHMALAGAVAINVPHKAGYLYREGDIYSPDGHCRPFDARAGGTIFGSGAGVVVLKRLEDALADGDTIHAIIKGSATNNDGAEKATFTAPGIEGQVDVILEAHANANISADTISYVEAHGTGTALGDPIEVLALTEAFRASTDKTQFCAIGSVKSNLGHLDAAAGMSSLLKTVLALKHRQIPPTLHFEQPNPRMEIASSPFFVNSTLRPWQVAQGPRRAGVSSFGFGGTNAHIILEEAPSLPPSGPSRPWQLLLLSARSEAALDTMATNLADHLRQQPDLNLADAAYTLQVGRKAFAHRRVIVCQTGTDVADALETGDAQAVLSGLSTAERSVAFLLPGQGAQYVGMGHELYAQEPVFRAAVDTCCALLLPQLGLDLRSVLYPPQEQHTQATAQLTQTAIAQPALFVIEYALAQLWQSWGITPDALLGHSIGEYVAATLAGVMTLDDALTLVATRGRLMQTLPPGAMLAIPRGEAEVRALLPAALDLAAVNGPNACVVSGPSAAIDALAAQLAAQGLETRRLHTSHAFHSAMLDPILPAFRAAVQQIRLQPPQTPFISNRSGTWITAEEATDPAYWVQHLRQPVRFADGLAELLSDRSRLLLEVGPGTVLSTLARQQQPDLPMLPSLRHPNDQRSDLAFMLLTLGKLWIAGATIDWEARSADEQRRRVPLPTYPFERKRYWIDMSATPATQPSYTTTLKKRPQIEDWLYRPEWQHSPLIVEATSDARLRWLVFSAANAASDALVARLRATGQAVTVVETGAGYTRVAEDHYSLNPAQAEDYATLLTTLRASGRLPQRIVHAWLMTADADHPSGLDTTLERGFYSVLYLAQALQRQRATSPIQLTLLATRLQHIHAGEVIDSAKAAILGPWRVLPQEQPNISCRAVDVELPTTESELDQLLAELTTPVDDPAVAYRAGERWVQVFAPQQDRETEPAQTLLRDDGTYLIIGGLGNLGQTLATHIAHTVRANLVLLGRSALPTREAWDAYLAAHDEHEPIARKLRQIQALEALGAQVLVLQADISDLSEISAAVAEAERVFGALHGVIHAAGVARGASFRAIQDTGASEAAAHFEPKIHGLIVLAQALQNRRLDFCLLQASLASVLGGLGNVAYAAASQFMDAFAYQQRQHTGIPWISVDWDSWHQADDPNDALGVTLSELAISPDEGRTALLRILSRDPGPQVIVSTGDLHARIEQWVKLDALRDTTDSSAQTDAAQPLPARNELARQIAAIWQRVLDVPRVGFDDNFFDLGGNSLSGMQLIAELRRELHVQIAPVTLFEAPTVNALTAHLSPELHQSAPQPSALARSVRLPAEDQQAIAIIGMTGRFPGAQNVEAFWQNLRDGVESITFFDDDQLSEAGIPAVLLDDPNYVKARPVIGDAAAFDAAFFGYTPREAELMDPQQRIFLECAWEALEQTGYATTAYPGAIGVFAGASISTYLLGLYTDPAFVASIDPLQTIIGNDKDSLATTVSYKFNLKGPSLTVQTYCSTSLVAVHLARQSLLRGECDVALAGGVSIVVPQASGYHYQEEGIVSPDGHCRTFDASAAGTLFGNGAGIVVLKRLEDALVDGDTIHAVVRGTAINNDGAHKVGYTAPSVDGQAAVIRAALNDAGVSADSIDYIEAHGTGTALGDPIEITALTKAFRADTTETGYCAIGSVKTNIGHLDRAAGVAALIKTVLALKHQQIPPSLHFEQPNPRIDFANSPFYVNANLAAWEARQHPRRAGVSALGFGGTNAHIIVEEAPPTPSAPAEAWHLLTLSARTTTALDQASLDLAAYLRQHPDANLSDVAYTLQVGRKAFVERRVVVCRTADEAVSALEGHDPQQLLSASAAPVERPVVFLFPGQGAQYVNMARDLYQHAPVFRQHVDRCADILKPHLDADLRDVLWSDAAQLDQTIYTQPALFVIEYALAQLWLSWGLKPQAMLGHSLGEYVAACLAGVFSLEDGLKLVARRGQLMQHMPPGSMVSVSMSEAELLLYLEGTPEISLAAINGPERCVVAGPQAAVAALVERLERMDVACRALHTDRAFHSIHIDQIAQEFRAALEDVQLHAPQIPYLSNLTGRPITAAEATDRGYWLRQMREPVRFSDCVAELAQDNSRIFLEVGPGTTLSGLVRQHDRQLTTLASLRHRDDSRDDLAFMLATLGRLWMTGAPVEWLGLYSIGPRRRIPLPTYPFERQNYWLSSQRLMPIARPQASTSKLKNIADWFYVPTWQHTPVPALPAREVLAAAPRVWLILSDVHGIGPAIGQQLRQAEHEVIFVTVGEQFRQLDNGLYELNPRQAEDYAALLDDLRQHSQEPTEILHLWSLSDDEQPKDWHVEFDTAQTYGFYSLLYLIQALGKRGSQTSIQLSVVSNQVYSVTPAEPIMRAKTTLLGMCKVIPQEYPTISCRYIDLALPNRSRSAQAATQIVAEVLTPATNPDIAYRGAQRWVQDFEPVRLAGSPDPLAPIRPEGVYLLTGGLAEIGFALTEYLATTAKARLVLIEPGAFPENDLWEQWLATHSDQHSVSRKIYRLQALIAAGAQILVINSSLTNTHELAAAVERASEQFGAINGVIHAATVVGEQAFRALQETTPDECEWHFTAKARSLFALEAVFRDHDLDFCLLVSSLAAFLGGRGYAAYAAANRFMDAFAQRHNQTSDQLWTSVNWDAWQIEDGRMTAMSQSLSALAMTPDEGGTALRRIVAWNAADQVLVSTAPLAPRIEELQQQAGALRASLISDDAAPATSYPRPQLPTAYIAPETELEQKIAAIWRRSLGFEQIGVYDNFFELGGDSLIAIRVVAQMKSELQIELSVVSLYERLTIKALAEFLEQGGDNPPDLVQADDQESKINRRKQYRQTKRSGK